MLTRQLILDYWKNQNPKLVRALKASAQLDGRLTEALEYAKIIQADSVSRGLSPGQGEELAMDAVALPPPKKRSVSE